MSLRSPAWKRRNFTRRLERFQCSHGLMLKSGGVRVLSAAREVDAFFQGVQGCNSVVETGWFVEAHVPHRLAVTPECRQPLGRWDRAKCSGLRLAIVRPCTSEEHRTAAMMGNERAVRLPANSDSERMPSNQHTQKSFSTMTGDTFRRVAACSISRRRSSAGNWRKVSFVHPPRQARGRPRASRPVRASGLR